MKKIRYVGIYEQAFMSPTFCGVVNKGDEIEVDEVTYSERIGHDDWESVDEVKEKKKPTEKGEK